MESITPFLRSPLLTLSGPILIIIVLAFFWFRAGSVYALLERFWRLVVGKLEVTDNHLNEFIKQVHDLEKFRFMFGLEVNSIEELHKVLDWLKENSIGISIARAAKKWIDLKSENIIQPPPQRYILIRAVGLAVALVLTMATIEVTNSEFALLQMKGSKVWFLANANIIKELQSDWVIEKNQCEGNYDDISKITGFTKNEAKMICDALKDKSLEHAVADTVKTQKRIGYFLAICMIIYLGVMIFQLKSAEAALEIQAAITARIAQNVVGKS